MKEIRFMSNYWSFEEDEILKTNFEQATKEELLKMLPNRTWEAIYQRGKGFGLKRKCKQTKLSWSKEDVQILKDFYGKLSEQEICLKLKRNAHAIREYARRHNFSPKRNIIGKNEFQQATNPTLKPLLDESLQSYYWIGYLYSDGYILQLSHQLVLASTPLDLNHLNEFAKFLRTSAKTYKSEKSGFRSVSGFQVRVSVADSIHCPQLIKKFDFREQKTYNPPCVETLFRVFDDEKKFIPMFIGFIDGDGYINKEKFYSKIELHSSWQSFLSFLIDRLVYFKFLNTKAKSFINKRGYAQITINSSCIAKIKEFIKTNKIKVLERKWKTQN